MYALYKYAKKKRTQQKQNSASLATPASNFNEIEYVKVEPDVNSSRQPQYPNTSDPIPEEQKAESSEQKSKRRKYRWKVILCLWLPFFLSSLDLTIVATALPFIASHFNRFDQLNWAVTAFTLTSTAFIPIFGQLADIFGRHLSLQLATVSITVGSILCAAAPVWTVFLLGRAIQGVGTAGVTNVVLIVLADKVSLKEQAINQSIFQILLGCGYAIGPITGGYLTNSNWRYCFILPAAIGGASIITIFLLRKDLVAGTSSGLAGLKTVDFGGAVLFIASIALIILGTAYGGTMYAWSSAAVVAPIVIGSILLIAFVVYEHFIERTSIIPMIPSRILRNKEVSIVSILAAGTGAALYAVFYFIGIYFTLVEAKPASSAGTQLLYYLPGLGVGVYGAIFLVNQWPRQTFLPLNAGTIIETAGIAVLTYAVKRQNHVLVNVMMAIAGAGTGMRFMPESLHLAGMMRNDLAPAYSMLRFSMPFGGTLALTIMGAVFQNKLNMNYSLHDTSSLNAIATLPAAEQQALRDTGADATMWAFISILPFLGLSMLASFGLGNVRVLKQKKTDAERLASDDGVDGHEVDRGIYLLNLFSRGRSRA